MIAIKSLEDKQNDTNEISVFRALTVLTQREQNTHWYTGAYYIDLKSVAEHEKWKETNTRKRKKYLKEIIIIIMVSETNTDTNGPLWTNKGWE